MSAHFKVRVGGDLTQFNREMGNLKGGAAKTGASIAKSLMGPLAGIASVAGLKMVASAAIKAADDVGKGAARTAMGVEEYQRLAQMAKFAGSSIDAVETSVVRMSRVLKSADEESKTAQKSLEQLGISLEDIEGKGTSETFEKIAKAIAQTEDPIKRLGLAQEVFGRGAVQLMPLIMRYGELKDEVADMPVMTAEAVKAAEEFNDAMSALGTTIQNSIINSGLLEYLADTANAITEVQKGAIQAEKLGGRKVGFLESMASGFWEAVLPEGVIKDKFRAGQAKSGMFVPGESSTEPVTEEDVEAANEAAQAAKDEAEARKKSAAAAREQQAAAEEQARLEKEAAAAAEKAAALQERAEEATRQSIEDLQHAVNLQDMKNKGLEKEAAIQDALYQAMKRNADLTQDDIDAITEGAGKLFDLSQKLEEIKTEAESDPRFAADRDAGATALERIGAIMGGGSGGEDMGVRIQRELKNINQKQLATLENIERKTGGNALTEA